MPRSIVLDTGVIGGVLARITDDEVLDLARQAATTGANIRLTPNVLMELAFRPQKQRDLMAGRLSKVIQPKMLKSASEIIIAEFIGELRRTDETLADMMLPPSTDMISDVAFEGRFLIQPDPFVLEQAKREKLTRRLVQANFKESPIIQGVESARAIKRAYDDWHGMLTTRLEKIAPATNPKSAPLLHELEDLDSNRLAQFVDRGVRDTVYYDFAEPVISGNRHQNFVATQIIDNYPAARNPEYWGRFAEQLEPRRMPGLWLNIATSALQMSPTRSNSSGSDHFDSEAATHLKDIDVFVTADRELAGFLRTDLIRGFLTEMGRKPNVVNLTPEPTSFANLVASFSSE